MPGRNASSGDYRYGFNGYEKDDEVKNVTGSHLNFEGFGYDPRIAKRWNVDPKRSSYPWQSPYLYAADNPITNIDKDGEGDEYYMIEINQKTGKATYSIIDLTADDKPDKAHYTIHLKNKNGKVTTLTPSSKSFYSILNGLRTKNIVTETREIFDTKGELIVAEKRNYFERHGTITFGKGSIALGKNDASELLNEPTLDGAPGGGGGSGGGLGGLFRVLNFTSGLNDIVKQIIEGFQDDDKVSTPATTEKPNISLVCGNCSDTISGTDDVGLHGNFDTIPAPTKPIEPEP